MKTLNILVIPLMLIASACTAVQAQNDVSDLANSAWNLISFGKSNGEVPVIEGSAITLDFDDQGRFGGSGGCNSYGGFYSVDEGKLAFADLNWTLIACIDQAINDQEQRYLQALESASVFSVSETTLTILYDNNNSVLNYVRAANPTPSPSQSQERIEFDFSVKSVTRVDDLPAGGMKAYVVAAAAGETMHVKTTGNQAALEFTLIGPSGESWTSEQPSRAEYVSTADVIVPQNGDYLVTLKSPLAEGTNHYEITFTIETSLMPAALQPLEPPEAVTFTAGANSAQRSGTLPDGPARKQYVLEGKAGQQLSVEIADAQVPIQILFTTPSGMTGYRNGNKLMLEESGTYTVTLSKTGDAPASDYTVVFTVQ